MAIGQSSYWGAAGTEPNPFAGWSEERKRFFELNGYDRGPTPPETTVKVTETPPDDPTPTTRVTTTKYPEGMEQPGIQALREQGAFDPLGQGPGTVMPPDPTWHMGDAINIPPTTVQEMPPYMGAEEQWGRQEGLPAEGLLGPTDEELAASQAQAFQTDGALPLLQQEGEAFHAPAVLGLSDQDYIAGLPERHLEEGAYLTDTGEDLILTTGGGNDISLNSLLLSAMPAGRIGLGFSVGKRLISKLPRSLQKRIYTWLGNKRRAQQAAKPTEYDRKIDRPSAGTAAGPETKLAIPPGATTAGPRVAQTTAEAANAAKVAGTFAPIRTGIKTGLKVAAPLAAVGLLDEGEESEEARAAGEWPGLAELEGIPWWLKGGYDAARSALGAAGEFVVEKGGALVEGLVATEEDLDIKRAQATASPSQRYEGLLSAAEVAGLKPAEIAKDLQITHEKGLAGSTFTKSERHRLEAAEQYKEAEIKRVSAQDAAAKQADLDRYYANFPEDVGGKRERYLKALKEIYKKVAILNVIAALTNSPSQAGAFMQMAAQKFKTLEGFRGEERLQKIARGVFFDEDGVFDAPASKQDAFNKAMRFGANHDEAMELSGHKAEYAPKSTETGTRIWSNAETGQEIWLTKDQAPTGPGWLPKSLVAEKAGTEFERIRKEATSYIGAGQADQAVNILVAYLLGKDSMMRFMQDEAEAVAEEMVKRWAAGIDADERSVAAELGVGKDKIDLGEI